MPLSEHEQRILEEIEKNLYAEDPLFAKDVERGAPLQNEVRRAKLGLLSFVAGVAALISFFVTRMVLLGVVAFGAMVLGIVLLLGSLRGVAAALKPAVSRWTDDLKKRYPPR
ncbi:MAG TPA: DUF3040 domain-containing protein [Actinomycetota bacterium]|nr:DUF3040 domain-containing protein [Actinomycetota bacterium]